MLFRFRQEWRSMLEDELQQAYLKTLAEFVEAEYASYTCYPDQENIFAALDACPPEAVQVIILGQDPYHGPGQAHGLSFSVPEGMPIPPSLKNIFKEIQADLGITPPPHGHLMRWAEQGVLLLNATLSVRAHQAGSHQRKGWESFTDAIIRKLSDERENLVFMLWGNYAQKKGAFISEQKHLVLRAAHPSPLSAYQ
ncbi:MAG: uracil-DNA glycosylase, partial [Flavobacteriales bacterium]